jgi:hypothetical protein
MSNIVASLGNNVKFPVVQSLPASLESGTFCYFGNELYIGNASNVPVPACGYYEYVASLTQTGTNAPVATVIKNTLPQGALVYSFDSTGAYLATLASAFVENKTVVNVNTSSLYFDDGGDIYRALAYRTSLNTISIVSSLAGNAENGVLNMFQQPFIISVKVYL